MEKLRLVGLDLHSSWKSYRQCFTNRFVITYSVELIGVLGVMGSTLKDLDRSQEDALILYLFYMSIFKKILDWIVPPYVPPERKEKTLEELDILDDVWILSSDESLLKGWVFDINKKHIIVVIPVKNKDFLEFRFNVTRPLSQTKLVQNHKTLFLNEPRRHSIPSN